MVKLSDSVTAIFFLFSFFLSLCPLLLVVVVFRSLFPPPTPFLFYFLNNADLFFDPDTEGIDHLMAYLE